MKLQKIFKLNTNEINTSLDKSEIIDNPDTGLNNGNNKFRIQYNYKNLKNKNKNKISNNYYINHMNISLFKNSNEISENSHISNKTLNTKSIQIKKNKNSIRNKIFYNLKQGDKNDHYIEKLNLNREKSEDLVIDENNSNFIKIPNYKINENSIRISPIINLKNINNKNIDNDNYNFTQREIHKYNKLSKILRNKNELSYLTLYSKNISYRNSNKKNNFFRYSIYSNNSENKYKIKKVNPTRGGKDMNDYMIRKEAAIIIQKWWREIRIKKLKKIKKIIKIQSSWKRYLIQKKVNKLIKVVNIPFFKKLNIILTKNIQYFVYNKFFSKKNLIKIKFLKLLNKNNKKNIEDYFNRWVYNAYSILDDKSNNIQPLNFTNDDNINNYNYYEDNDDFLLRFSLIENKKSILIECLDTNNISKFMYSNSYNLNVIINNNKNIKELDLKDILKIFFNETSIKGEIDIDQDEFKLKINYIDNKNNTIILKKCKCEDNNFIEKNVEKKIRQIKREKDKEYEEQVNLNKKLIQENEKMKNILKKIKNINNRYIENIKLNEKVIEDLKNIQKDHFDLLNEIGNK